MKNQLSWAQAYVIWFNKYTETVGNETLDVHIIKLFELAKAIVADSTESNKNS